MKKIRIAFTPWLLLHCLWAILIVLATTLMMWLIGREVLGEAVIALLYLVPVAWIASRWGQVPGIIAALTAALAFNFFFIPPFYTFEVAHLEGWLVLIIFLAVAIVVVGRIQASISQAREATFMYELSSALADASSQEAVACTVANQLQRLYQARLVKVVLRSEGQSSQLVVSEPPKVEAGGRPDRVVPVVDDRGSVGEIQIWGGGYLELPNANSRLLQNFAEQTARAYDRTSRIGSVASSGDIDSTFSK